MCGFYCTRRGWRRRSRVGWLGSRRTAFEVPLVLSFLPGLVSTWVALQALVAGCKIDGSNLSCVEAQGGPLRQGTRLSAPLAGPQRDCGENQPGSDLQCPYPQLQGPLASHVSAESLEPLEKSSELASFPCLLLPDRRGLSSSRAQQGIPARSGCCSKGPWSEWLRNKC